MDFGGIDIRTAGGDLLFEAALIDALGELITTGTCTLWLFEPQADGTLQTYDFNDNTFKATACTTPSASMTHRTGDNGTLDTGVWTYLLSAVSGFTAGNLYYVMITHASASPLYRHQKFQFAGGGAPDQLHLVEQALTGYLTHVVATGVDEVLDTDGVTVLRTLTPSEAAGVITRTPS